ncbi:MAG: Crp/Fnr family transcriptional regulator [Alphaproteobacteria bacterium]
MGTIDQIRRADTERASHGGRRLDGISLFADLPPAVLRKLESQCRWQAYGANDRILDRDDEGRDVYFIVRGAVQIVNYSLGGREIGLGRIGAGSYFGELAAIDGQPRSASVIALEDCLMAAMTPRSFHDLVMTHPEIATRLLRRLARVIRGCDDRIMDVSTLSATQRVLLDLLRLAERDPNGSAAWVIPRIPTHKDIAAQASTTRETVARTISQLTAEGVVERTAKGLLIPDRALLEQLATEQESERRDRRSGLDRRKLRSSVPLTDGERRRRSDRRSGDRRRDS